MTHGIETNNVRSLCYVFLLWFFAANIDPGQRVADVDTEKTERKCFISHPTASFN